MKLDYPEAVRTLIGHLKRLPGIGPKSAERMALWMLQQKEEVLKELASSLGSVQEEITCCASCGFFATNAEGCALCTDASRDATIICIVEQPTDILPIERTGVFKGYYHALGGRLSPLDNVGPDDLRLQELKTRLDAGEFTEVVLALGADVSGEATANYLVEMLDGRGLEITKLAQGMPVGGGLDTADTLTVHRAFENRKGVASH